ncbi:hypothetical protein ENH_00012290 [Eimeria necatrix]|uniref:Uncharacterized protein n=1 Tax=Eimeria necatrix TaxID=51315 RepID=U6MGW3_9EIME|nr:hypothetical protein ENH_00012290 [Eimeria necatrix]CDJ62303.1 hypothetical protein ENH_00012290 [Eimeria necatrix]
MHSHTLKLLVYSAVVLFVALCARRQLQHLSEHGCRTGDSDLGGDISSRSQDSDEDGPSGDLRFNAQALGTGAAEEGVSRSCEDEASGGAAAAAPKPAADEEDDDPDSKRGHPAAGKECGKHTVERQGRARWMGPLAGFLETAGKKISSVSAKSDVAANPAAGGVVATVEADCDIRGVGTVILHIEIVEEFTRDLLALTEEMSVAISRYAERTRSFKADLKDSTDRGGEQGEPKQNAAIQAGNRASGFSANDLVGPVPTLQATVGDAATPAASDEVTAGTSGGTKNEAPQEAGSPKGAPQSLHKGDFDLAIQGNLPKRQADALFAVLEEQVGGASMGKASLKAFVGL